MVPSGVLLVDKAPDMTSHDVVAIARRAAAIILQQYFDIL